MNMDDLRKKEALCNLLVKAALLRGELSLLEEAEQLDSDISIAVSCAVSVAHNLEIQIMNSITSV